MAAQDPIGFAAGDANLYRYVGNGATNWVDPNGLQRGVYNPGGAGFPNGHGLPRPDSPLPAGPSPMDHLTGPADNTEYFEDRYPCTVKSVLADFELWISLWGKDVKGHKIRIGKTPKDGAQRTPPEDFGDEPQTYWERVYLLGRFTFEADDVEVETDDNGNVTSWEMDVIVTDRLGTQNRGDQGGLYRIITLPGRPLDRKVTRGRWKMSSNDAQ